MNTATDRARLDLLTLGRSCVDLYGEQIGGRLEDMASFAKYIGGSPTNTAVGAARLGLGTGLITRVGADHMGRFIREELVREGVDISGVIEDPARLTALVILGIRDRERFPLIFYRENCADMALSADDIDGALIARARALLINGTHLSTPGVRAASIKAAEAMKAGGGRVIFDIDYRPVLWGLTARDEGDDRFVASAAVTSELRGVLPLCDLIVGTEEEVHILGGTTDTIAALRAIREQSAALLVCKRGAAGCVAFSGKIDSWEDGVTGQGLPIEVFNVLGAGDAFMAGFLRGWLRNEPLERCCSLANACGALVVSRHGCAPAMPSWEELELFLSRSDWPHRLREAAALEQLHWTDNRARRPAGLFALAIDHRAQFDDLAHDMGADALARVPAFKRLALEALDRVAAGDPAFGKLLDTRLGQDALEAAADTPYWIGRPIEIPGSRPVEFEGSADVAVTLREWPRNHVVKCLVFYHPDDPNALKEHQDRQLQRLFAACRATRHELLIEIVASKHGPIDAGTVAKVIERIYDLGVYPDWWKLEPSDDPAAWTAISGAIAARDPECRGVVLLGLAAAKDELLASFAATDGVDAVKGFAVGRTIWQEPAVRWLRREIDDAEAVAALAATFRDLVEAWRARRGIRAAA